MAAAESIVDCPFETVEQHVIANRTTTSDTDGERALAIHLECFMTTSPDIYAPVRALLLPTSVEGERLLPTD